MDSDQPWYAVKCVFRHDRLASDLSLPQAEGEVLYEERIVVFRAGSFEEAITLGESEAKIYAGDAGTVHYTGFLSAYHLFEAELKSGVEVYSLMRQSKLDPEAFLDRYHDDRTERTQ